MSHSARGQIPSWLLGRIAQQMRLSPDNCNNSWTAPSAETNGWEYGKCLLVKYDDELVPIVTA